MKICGVLMIGVLGLAGCAMDNILTHRQEIPRAELALQPLQAERGVEQAPPAGLTGEPRIIIDEQETGTYVFTTPENVTRIKESGPNLGQYRLYLGDAKPTDKPFVTIVLAPEVRSEAAAGDGDLKAEATRTYLLNGLTTQEWTGHTTDGRPFCELIVSHGAKGDKLHAVAIARDARTRELALEILGSIKWKRTGQ